MIHEKKSRGALELPYTQNGSEARATTTYAEIGLTSAAMADTVSIRVRRVRRVTSRQCSRFVQQQIAASLPEICEGLLQKARQGDVACAKALWKMAEFDQGTIRTRVKPSANRGLAFARKVLAEFETRKM